MVKMARIDAYGKRLVRLYRGQGWKSIFARIRLLDAPYKETEQLMPRKGAVLELGCGEGLFSNYLALTSAKRKVTGIEIDKKRIKNANRGLPNTNFILGDATKFNMPKANAIVMMHLLHHLNSFREQESLLKKCKSRLEKSGKMIIVEIDPRLSLKYFITWFVDHFLVPWIFEEKFYSRIYFRKKKEWTAMLEKMGFKVKSYRTDRWKPFSHIIFECTK